MKRYTLLFMSLILVFACDITYSKETKVKVKEWKSRNKPVLRQVEFKDFWEAVSNLDVKFPERNNLDQAHRDFAQGLQFVTEGEIEKAEESFKKVILSTSDPELEKHAKELYSLFVGYRMGYNPEILFQEEKPGKTDRTHPRKHPIVPYCLFPMAGSRYWIGLRYNWAAISDMT